MAIGDYIKMRDRDIPPYQTVMRSMIKHYGTLKKTLRIVGIADESYYRLMNDGELTVCVARKIMAGYTAMKNEKVAA